MPVGQPHEKVGAIFASYALVEIGNLEAEVIILRPSSLRITVV